MSVNKFKGIVKLTEEQYSELKKNGSLTTSVGTTITYDPTSTLYITPDIPEFMAVKNEDNKFSTDQTINGNLVVNGDIIQQGETYITHTEELYSKKDYIYLREDAQTGLLDNTYSGLEFIKYDGINNGRLVIDNKGIARVGDIGDEQPLTTREESPIDYSLQYWNPDTNSLKSSGLTIKQGLNSDGLTILGNSHGYVTEIDVMDSGAQLQITTKGTRDEQAHYSQSIGTFEAIAFGYNNGNGPTASKSGGYQLDSNGMTIWPNLKVATGYGTISSAERVLTESDLLTTTITDTSFRVYGHTGLFYFPQNTLLYYGGSTYTSKRYSLRAGTILNINTNGSMYFFTGTFPYQPSVLFYGIAYSDSTGENYCGEISITSLNANNITLSNNLNLNKELTFTDTSNPFIKMTSGGVNYYFQANDSKFGLGPTWEKATKWDTNGNAVFGGTVKIGGCTLAYNTTNKALEFNF